MTSSSSDSGSAKYAWARTPRAQPAERSVPERLGDFRGAETDFDEATARLQASRCIQCAMPYCVIGCPHESPIGEWLGLVAEGRMAEAAELARRSNALPDVCARLCPSGEMCEAECLLKERGEPVAIGAIERFLFNYAAAHEQAAETPPAPNGLRVAVVGTAPAGLATAAELARRGYAVTVIESHLEPGGSWFRRVPPFKLEREILERQLEVLRRTGVRFVTRELFGREVGLEDLLRQYDAVFLAIGAQQSVPENLPGTELTGVMPALEFLARTAAEAEHGGLEGFLKGRQVVVLGAGDTGIDCVRSALRCGARSVQCLYRREVQDMAGCLHEYHLAVDEGALFQERTSAVRLTGDRAGHVCQVVCQHNEFGEPDADGRRRVRSVAGTDWAEPADLVVVAFGFQPASRFAGSGLEALEKDPAGFLMVDEQHMTKVPGLFAGGELVRKRRQSIEAVRDGREMADTIDRYLRPAEKT